MLELISHQRPNWALSHALIGGAQPYMVGGPPSHCIYREVGTAGLRHEVELAATPPPPKNPRLIQGGCAANDGKPPPSSPSTSQCHHWTATPLPPLCHQRYGNVELLRQARWFASLPLSLSLPLSPLCYPMFIQQ
jgi:hypothetical protein